MANITVCPVCRQRARYRFAPHSIKCYGISLIDKFDIDQSPINFDLSTTYVYTISGKLFEWVERAFHFSNEKCHYYSHWFIRTDAIRASRMQCTRPMHCVNKLFGYRQQPSVLSLAAKWPTSYIHTLRLCPKHAPCQLYECAENDAVKTVVLSRSGWKFGAKMFRNSNKTTWVLMRFFSARLISSFPNRADVIRSNSTDLWLRTKYKSTKRSHTDLHTISGVDMNADAALTTIP